jgi:hypothetical protein
LSSVFLKKCEVTPRLTATRSSPTNSASDDVVDLSLTENLSLPRSQFRVKSTTTQ